MRTWPASVACSTPAHSSGDRPKVWREPWGGGAGRPGWEGHGAEMPWRSRCTRPAGRHPACPPACRGTQSLHAPHLLLGPTLGVYCRPVESIGLRHSTPQHTMLSPPTHAGQRCHRPGNAQHSTGCTNQLHVCLRKTHHLVLPVVLLGPQRVGKLQQHDSLACNRQPRARLLPRRPDDLDCHRRLALGSSGGEAGSRLTATAGLPSGSGHRQGWC